jgi:hypothetical protein
MRSIETAVELRSTKIESAPHIICPTTMCDSLWHVFTHLDAKDLQICSLVSTEFNETATWFIRTNICDIVEQRDFYSLLKIYKSHGYVEISNNFNAASYKSWITDDPRVLIMLVMVSKPGICDDTQIQTHLFYNTDLRCLPRSCIEYFNKHPPTTLTCSRLLAVYAEYRHICISNNEINKQLYDLPDELLEVPSKNQPAFVSTWFNCMR